MPLGVSAMREGGLPVRGSRLSPLDGNAAKPADVVKLIVLAAKAERAASPR